MLYVLGALGAAILGWVALATKGRAGAAPDSSSGPADPANDPPGDRGAADEATPTHDAAGHDQGQDDRSSTSDRTTGQATPSSQGGGSTAMTTQAWSAPLAGPCLAAGIPLPYALRWIEMESGGNPCAVGYPPAHGPDGEPLELGIAQLYNPDDLGVISPRLTGAELRAYCVPGDHHQVRWPGGTVVGFSSEMSRPLTQAEIQRQADATVALIQRSMREAQADLVSVGATWSSSRRDYWALVKLQHGLPALSRQGLPRVTAYLGHPPSDWAEFARSIDRIRLDDRTEQRFRKDFPRILDNAQRCASAVPERGVMA